MGGTCLGTITKVSVMGNLNSILVAAININYTGCILFCSEHSSFTSYTA